ncbi:MAG TPA: hypothetical protein VK212_05230 [Lentimicrobium sp.]|nr:hypothetical protein [Lentimicrobium sp.]
MKKLALLSATMLLITTSCLKEGTNYVKYTGNINIDTLLVQDTARLGDTVDISVRGGAPNGCWSNLELMLTKENDSLVFLTGIGLFESRDGICADIYQNIDSVFSYKPADTGKIVFIGWSPGDRIVKDSLYVLP